MAESPAPDRQAAPEIEVAGATGGSLQKVELDLDDAPFLKKDEPPPPARQEDVEPEPDDGAAQAKARARRKKLLIFGGAAALLLGLGGAGAAWFFGRTPPPAPPPLPGPEVVVVPAPAPVAEKKEYIKEFMPFVVPRHMHAEDGPALPARGSVPVGTDTRFLVCKFSVLATDPNVSQELDRQMLPLRDAVYYYLLSKSSQFLTDAHNGELIKTDLRGVVNDYLTQGKIEDILFESYLNK